MTCACMQGLEKAYPIPILWCEWNLNNHDKCSSDDSSTIGKGFYWCPFCRGEWETKLPWDDRTIYAWEICEACHDKGHTEDELTPEYWQELMHQYAVEDHALKVKAIPPRWITPPRIDKQAHLEDFFKPQS